MTAIGQAADPAEKGVPFGAASLASEHVADQRWNVAAGDLPLPVATLCSSAVAHNIATMANWCRERGVLLAPHGKTTMAPALFARQLDAGAWGITVSTARQARIAARAGAERVIVANQIVDPVQLEALAALADEEAVDIAVFVDSLAGIDRVARRADGTERLSVLVEMGMSGGRTGVRTEDELFGLLERVAGDDAVRLAGVSAFEGILPAIRRPLPEAFGGGGPDTTAVEEYLARVATAIGGARARGLLDETAIVTAGGSSAFDLVVAALRDVAGPLVLRSGCYVTHDHGLYLYQSPLQEGNDPALDRGDALRPALSVWAHVVSTPEPGTAVLGFGRRDVGDDFGMPSPTGRVLGPGRREPVGGWAVTRLWDQHALMDAGPSATVLEVGDVLTFGISHPCTTFDKWRILMEIDDDDRVLGTVETRF